MNSIKNLGTYSTNWIPKDLHDAHVKYLGYNAININEYPEITGMTNRLSEVFKEYFMSSCKVKSIPTTGSTEACLITALHYKNNPLRKFKGTPNIVMNKNVHSSWKRVCDYLGIEARCFTTDVNIFEGVNTFDKEDFDDLIDENTCMFLLADVYTTLGVRDDILKYIKYIKSNYHSLPIHIDAAIGGFIPGDNPTKYRFEGFDSINFSNHKYGFSYPGLGWLLIKDQFINQDFIQSTEYLKGTFTSMGFTFTKSAANIASQYELFKDGWSRHRSLFKEVLNTMEESHRILKCNSKIWKDIPVEYSFDPDYDYMNELSNEYNELGYSCPVSPYYVKDKVIYVMRAIHRLQKDYDEAFINKPIKHTTKWKIIKWIKDLIS